MKCQQSKTRIWRESIIMNRWVCEGRSARKINRSQS